jgi:alkanesulfonate monooxygenase SsuD/methylene tetrahydromethanopterin reductase-like flavin-dependent oxidoreductase (luciferase family)
MKLSDVEAQRGWWGSMKVGLLMAPMHPFESYRMLLGLAEEAKVDSLWVPDHLLGCAHPALWADMALASLSPDADAWHPAGDQCRGLVDLIYHDLASDLLRELAPAIPFELVEEFVFIGNATEITDRVSGYADNGLGHVILGNATGTVGGIEEITANTGELLALVAAIGEL